MHESSLARGVLDAVLARVPAGHRVAAVRGWVAETEALHADALVMHFAGLAQGTAAEGATLHLDLRHVAASCAACGAVYLPEHHLTLCPHCGGTEATLLGRTGLGVDEIDVLPLAPGGA